MSLLDRIEQDLDVARRARDSVPVELLRTLKGEIGNAKLKFNPARAITDDEIVAIVRKFSKNNAETVAALQAADRPDDLAKAQRECAVLSGYLPSQMSEQDLEAFISIRLAEGPQDMGQIMAALKAQHPGQYDGKLASQTVKRVLAA